MQPTYTHSVPSNLSIFFILTNLFYKEDKCFLIPEKMKVNLHGIWNFLVKMQFFFFFLVVKRQTDITDLK